MQRQTLIFDADDTLWENNVYFERVIADYLDWLEHPTLDHAEIREVLNDIERANASTHGYGSRAFLTNLHECFHTLNARALTEAEHLEIERMAADLLAHRIDLFSGVAETLATLGSRHDLKLMTKGEQSEQQRKIDASDLGPLFSSVHIVREKDPATYAEIAAAQQLLVEHTWMIGNSPKSDILPARAIGMGAVFIPNEDTWVLEHAELDPADAGVLVLGSFPELLQHF